MPPSIRVDNSHGDRVQSQRSLVPFNWYFMAIQGMAWLLIPLLLVEEGQIFLAALSWSLLLLPYVLGAGPAGHFGDQHSRLLTLTFALISSLAAAILLFAAIVSAAWLVPLVLLASLLFGLARPFADAAIIGELSEYGQAKERLNRMSRAVAGEPGGRVIGAALLWTSLIAGNGDFFFAGLLLILLSVLIFIPLVLTRGLFKTPSSRSHETNHGSSRTRLVLIVSQPGLLAVVIFGVLWNLFMAGIIGGLAPAFIQQLINNINAQEVALLLLAASAVSVTGSLLSPLVNHALGPTKTLWLSTASATIILLLTTSWQGAVSWPLTAALLLLFYFVNQIFVTNLIVQRQMLAPKESSSIVATLTRMITWVALAAGTLLYGALLSLWSATTILYLMAALASALLFVYLFVWREIKT